MKNYKLILCLLVVIIASLSCVAASEDVNTTTTTDNNADNSIATDNVAIDEPDEVQVVNNIDNGNDDGAGLYAADSGDSKASYKSNNNDDGDGVQSSYSLDKPIKATHGISNENHAKISAPKATTYNGGNSQGVNGNFSALQKVLNDSSNNNNISLNCSNYTYNNTQDKDVSGSADDNCKASLNITDKNLTIYGNGSNNPTGFTTIDGNSSKHSGNYTLVINGTSNVTLYNIIFTNSNRTAVYINLTEDGSATFINCIFRNNIANASEEDGGAVYINSPKQNKKFECNFTNCSFSNNFANNSGGAVIVRQNATAIFTDCNFTNNYANASTLSTKNDASIVPAAGGGAVKLGSNVTVSFTGCNFRNNTVGNDTAKTQGRGGAVYVDETNSTTTINFTNCNFTGNNALHNGTGGAVYLYPNSTTVFNNTVFEGNNASSGGAVFVNSNETKGNSSATFINTKFINNTANGTANANGQGIDGGAVYVYYNSTVNFTNSEFINNIADKNGGAISLRSNATGIFNNVTFDGNSVKGHASDKTGLGGALKLGTNVNVNITNCKFYNNHATNQSGALYIKDITKGNTLNVTNTTFINNTAGIDGGAVYMYHNASANFVNCTFEGNVANNSGGAVILRANATANFTGTTFNNNTAKSNNYSKSGGGAVKLGTNCSVVFNNTSFNNNTALGSSSNNLGNGSAVYIDDNNQTANTKFINSSFTGNKADLGTVYMYINSTTSFVDCNFTGNQANQGGAVYMSTNSSANFTGVRFVNNSAVYGGVVYISTNATGRFTNCTFINNTAREGGVAYINGATNTPPSNEASASYAAAALFSTGNTLGMGLGLFDGCTFEDNSASDKGGVVYDSGALNITDSSMDNNTANSGAVVYVSGTGSGNITDSNFTHNTASLAGGAVYNEGKFNITESEFDNNTATLAGAIYSSNDVNMTNNVFRGNSATAGNGGGVYIYDGRVNLTGSNFTANTATIDGGAVYVGPKGNTSVNNVTFENNTARDGASIYSAGSMTLSDVVSDVPFVNVGVVGSANLTILDNRTVNIYADYADIYAVLDQDINTTLYFQITSDNKTSYVPATYIGNATYYYRFDITQFGQTYTISAPSLASGIENLTVKNATLFSIDQFNINITANNVTVSDVNSTANNTIEIYLLNGGHTLNGSNVTVYVNNESYIVELNGRSEGSLILENLTPDEYNVTVVYGNGTATVNNTAVFYVKYPVNINDTTITFTDNGDNTTNVSVVFPEDATGNITVTVNGTEYNATIINGTARFTVNGSFPDFADVGIYYPGNNVTSGFNDTVILDLRKIELNVTGSTVTTGDNSTINIDLTINDVAANDEVTVTVIGSDYEEIFNASVVNGSAVVDLGALEPGAYNVTVQYSNKIVSTVVYVKNNITIDDIIVEASENADGTANLTVTVPEGVTGNITFTVGGKNYTAEIINGTASVSTDQLYDDAFNVTVSYEGDDANYPFNYAYTFDTTQITVNVENVTMYYRNGSGVLVTVNKDGTPVAGQNVTITINGRSYNRTTDENGSAKLTLNLNPGVYNVTTTYVGSDGQEYTVESMVTILSTINGEDMVKYYGNGTRYYASFVDGEGNPLANTTVTFNIHGVYYNATTDENGTASLAINLLPNDYIITAYNPINNQSYSNNITVLNTLNTTNLVKYFRNGSQFSASVVDGTGSAVEGATVTFNINGVFYNRTTGVDGVATLNINLNPGDYTITTYNTLTGQSMGNTVKVLPVLTGEDLTKVYGQSGSYVAHLVDSQGNPYANQQVTFNIHGRMYTAFTNADGDASLAINLLPGRYVITAYAGSASNSNIITVVGGA